MSKTLSDSDVSDAKAVADVEHYGEKVILPSGMSIKQAVDLLHRREEYLNQPVNLTRDFKVFPWDGAYALEQVLRQKYGWASQKALRGLFGEKPPDLISIEIGVGSKVSVPWGQFTLPNVEGQLLTGYTFLDGVIAFQLRATVLRKDLVRVEEIFNAVDAFLKTGSIYQGKAIRIRFRDADGDKLKMPEPKFIETRDVDPSTLVYSEDVEAAVETNLFTPIVRARELKQNGIPFKRGVLLGGTYGTGKTMGAKVAARFAVEAGVTFIYVTRADELADAIQFAKLYQDPAAVVFCEDIDRATEGERDEKMDDLLNTIDGIDSKTQNVMVVLTTNKLDAVNPAMLRPGRLDAVIDVTPPDGLAVERLIKVYAGNTLDPEANLHRVGVSLAGQIPAVIAEVVKRAKLSQLRLNPVGQHVTHLTESALMEAANTMTAQIRLLNKDRGPKGAPALEQALRRVVSKSVRKAIMGDFSDAGEETFSDE